MHLDTETLLLVALAAPIAPELREWVHDHATTCGSCSDRFAALLEARTRDDQGEGQGPLLAAASTARVWAAPAPLAALGRLGDATVYRVPGDALRFGVDSVEWIGKKLVLAIPGEAPIEAEVDAFRRLRLADGAARLAAALERGAAIEVEVVER